MHCIGDLHNIAAEVEKFDPRYALWLNPVLGKYVIMEKHRRWQKEGVLNGLPLFSFADVWEQTMKIDYIDAEKEAPDMRIVWDLYKKDLWRYPGGPKAFLEDIRRDDAREKRKRDAAYADKVNYIAQERHKYIVREFDGMPDLKTIHSVKGVN